MRISLSDKVVAMKTREIAENEQGYIVLTIEYQRHKDGEWSAKCLELGTAVDGDTLEETEKLIKEFVEGHLNLMDDLGARGQFFKKHDLVFHRHKPKRIKMSGNLTFKDRSFVQPYIQRISTPAGASR